MERLGERLEAVDLRPTEASVLVFILNNPGISQSEIGRILAIAGANMTPMIARLDGRGLLKRTQVDGRTFSLALTANGLKIARAAYGAMTMLEEDLLGLLPAGDRKAFAEMLLTLLDSIETLSRPSRAGRRGSDRAQT
ncbi:MAG: MarR family transcriptional regulator [Alphaproteobacteria bacterium]|nr:MAG: MarR family transcriptional regulator [Caulobacteraceae bacterium]TPW02686.1 MAG: MarR family transcriptional regulator [Alphaproteobacteria bacterium]